MSNTKLIEDLINGYATSEDLSTYKCIFKNLDGTWKYSWMQ